MAATDAGVGFYFRNVTENILFGVRGKNARTLKPGRRQVNYLESRKREHSRKPDELYPIIEACSPGPYLELFARGRREGWAAWGDQADDYAPSWPTYAHNSAAGRPATAEGPENDYIDPAQLGAILAQASYKRHRARTSAGSANDDACQAATFFARGLRAVGFGAGSGATTRGFRPSPIFIASSLRLAA